MFWGGAILSVAIPLCPVIQVAIASWEARTEAALVMTVLEAGEGHSRPTHRSRQPREDLFELAEIRVGGLDERKIRSKEFLKLFLPLELNAGTLRVWRPPPPPFFLL